MANRVVEEEGWDERELGADWSSDLEAVLYAAEVEEAISEVCPSSDPLDSKDFNPVDYINQLFPSEQSLAGIDDAITRVKVKVQQKDEEIRSVVRGQADVGHDGGQALGEAQHSIAELFGRIRSIKEKAERSEHMVKKITSDIKQLDSAKKHLTDSVRTLERLRFLITTLEDLQHNVRLRNYSLISPQLNGALSVMEEFSKYHSIPQVKQLLDRLESLQFDLGQQVKVDFERAFSTKGAPKGTKAQLQDACRVVDILGDKWKKVLTEWFVRMQLSDYEMLFHESMDSAWLDKVDRRYAWLKRTLVNYEEECLSIFPEEWGIPEQICVQFCSITRKNLTNLMQTRAGDLEVKLLLFAIQKTTAFEKFLAQRFSHSKYIETEFKTKKLEPAPEKDEDGDTPDGRRRHRKLQHQDSPFLGLLSHCFEPHLSVYISSQDKNLSDLINSFVADIKSKPPIKPANEGGTIVLPTAADIFVFYKKCLVQCTSLSTGPPLLQLTELFQKHLKEYTSRVLTAYLPTKCTSTSSKLNLVSLRKETQDVKFSRDELTIICSILCTSDYCLDTTQQLETKLKEKIDKSLVERVDFSQEQEAFHGVISNCIQLLVQDVETVSNSAFSAMVKIPWQNVEQVGDQSPYVSTIAAHVRSAIPLLRDNLSSARKYFINFCHKLANAFVPTFITHLYKCKPISTIAAEQLLLDTHSLKTCLLDLPSVGSAVSRKPPTSYSKLVTKGMEKAELILKVAMSPHQQAEDYIASYCKLMQGDTDTTNFQKILEMKGLKRSEQNALIELFKTRVSTSSNHSPPPQGLERTLLPIRKLEKMIRF